MSIVRENVNHNSPYRFQVFFIAVGHCTAKQWLVDGGLRQVCGELCPQQVFCNPIPTTKGDRYWREWEQSLAKTSWGPDVIA